MSLADLSVSFTTRAKPWLLLRFSFVMSPIVRHAGAVEGNCARLVEELARFDLARFVQADGVSRFSDRAPRPRSG